MLLATDLTCLVCLPLWPEQPSLQPCAAEGGSPCRCVCTHLPCPPERYCCWVSRSLRIARTSPACSGLGRSRHCYCALCLYSSPAAGGHLAPGPQRCDNDSTRLVFTYAVGAHRDVGSVGGYLSRVLVVMSSNGSLSQAPQRPLPGSCCTWDRQPAVAPETPTVPLDVLSFFPVRGRKFTGPLPLHRVCYRSHQESRFYVRSFHFQHFHLVIWCSFYVSTISCPAVQGAFLFNARVLVISRSPGTPARLLHTLSHVLLAPRSYISFPSASFRAFLGGKHQRDCRKQRALPARAEPSPALGPRTAPLTCRSGLALWLWTPVLCLTRWFSLLSSSLPPAGNAQPLEARRLHLGKARGAETHVLSPVVPPLRLECKGVVSRRPCSVPAPCSVL